MSPRKYWVHNGGERMFILGYQPIKKADEDKWKPGKEENSWKPRRNTKAGRKLAKEFDELPKWETQELQDTVKYSLMWRGGYVYFFNPFWHTNGFCGMRVPMFDKENYKPIKGMKAISCKMYNKKAGMSKAEYLATLPSSGVRKKSQTKSTSRSTSASTIKSRGALTRTKGHSQSART